MSFILDALKKSEHDRQRRSSPETAYVAASAPEARSGRWVWIVGGLLAINAVALLFVLLKGDTSPATGPVADPSSAPGLLQSGTDNATARSEQAAVSSPARPVQRTVPERSRIAAAQTAVEQSEAPPAEPSPAPAQPDPEPARQAQTSGSTGTSVEFTTLNQARIDGLQVEELHLDIHVFSESVSERFVFINMSKYREGDRLDEGPRVVEIRPEGVLLEQSGTVFLLPRE